MKAGVGQAHTCPVRRGDRRRLPGLPAIDRDIRRRARLFRRGIQLLEYELDQAELPLDDVSVRLGHQGRTGSDAGCPDSSAGVRCDSRGRGLLDICCRGIRRSGCLEEGRCRIRRPASVGSRPLAGRREAQATSYSARVEGKDAGAIRPGVDVDIEYDSEFVETQRQLLVGGSKHTLVTPSEAVYPVADADVALKLGVETVSETAS